jgi:hypothetical protein
VSQRGAELTPMTLAQMGLSLLPILWHDGRLEGQVLAALTPVPSTPGSPRRTQWQTSIGIPHCVRTLTVSLPRTSADIPFRPCEAITIRSQFRSFAASMMAL